MLSIFLLLSNLEKKYDLKRYLKRRALRIWPIYWGCLIVFLLFFRMPIGQFWKYVFFIQYFTEPNETNFIAGVFWTLQIEEFAYLVFPLVSKLGREEKKILALILTLVGIYSLILGLQFGYLGLRLSGIQRTTMALCLLPYGLGLLAYCVRFSPRLRFLAPIGLGMLTVQNMSVSLGQSDVLAFASYLVTLFGFAAFLRDPPKFLGKFTLLGEVSYAFYAIHATFLSLFGVTGLLLALPAAFGIEFMLRPREIINRLRIAYGNGPNVIISKEFSKI